MRSVQTRSGDHDGVAEPTAQMSLDDSQALVDRLGVQYDQIPIEPAMQVYSSMLGPYFKGLPEDTTEENLQSRIRGNLLMAFPTRPDGLF